jgi:DNA-binding SARP family transcriptional activator
MDGDSKGGFRSDADGVVATATLSDARSVAVCLLGGFRLLKLGEPVEVRAGGKTQALLSTLALRHSVGVAREELIGLVWPSSDTSLGGQSLNTLVSSVNRSLGDALGGRPSVVHSGGRYRLNEEDGVGVDIAWFDDAIAEGDRCGRSGDGPGAMRSYRAAIELYVGDLALAALVDHVVERERLRARYLSLRARLADALFAVADYSGALDNALDLLAHDPCREDAHRMAMRSYVRLGQRAQALRQYMVCRSVLEREFDAPPEPMTQALFDLVRLQPDQV